MLLKPLQHRAQTTCRQPDAGIRSAVIYPNSIAVRRQRVPAWEYHVVNVAALLVGLLRSENPFVAAHHAVLRRVQIEQSKPQPVDGARRGMAYAMVYHQPPLSGLNRWR